MFNSTRQKKKLFGGKSEIELEVYLCTGKQKKRFRREKLHRRLEIYPKFNASQTLTKKKKKKKLHRTSSASKHLCFYLAKTEVYPKTLSYLMFDHFSAFILLS